MSINAYNLTDEELNSERFSYIYFGERPWNHLGRDIKEWYAVVAIALELNLERGHYSKKAASAAVAVMSSYRSIIPVLDLPTIARVIHLEGPLFLNNTVCGLDQTDAVTRICVEYALTGSADPGYIANVIHKAYNS